MTAGQLASYEPRPQFSGHETFPLRHGWLIKSVGALCALDAPKDRKSIFTGADSIARFGVGKNMVVSMRHWANAVGVISESDNSTQIEVSKLGESLFGPQGIDRYAEHPSTLWLIHWNLASTKRKPTWFWAFNHLSSSHFDRELMVRTVQGLIHENGFRKVALTTIRRDVDCFIRTYASKSNAIEVFDEDSLESPLTELGLIQQLGRRDGFRLIKNKKPSLSNAVFAYALAQFWDTRSSGRTLSLEAVTYEPGSPGRVFLLQEEDVAERMRALETDYPETFRWSETAGLRQITSLKPLDDEPIFSWIESDICAVEKVRKR